MSDKKFLRSFISGKNNVVIRKAGSGGLTKTDFTKKLLTDEAVLAKAGAIKSKYNVSGTTFANHSDKDAIHSELLSLVRSQSDGKVSVRSSQAITEPKAPPADSPSQKDPKAKDRSIGAAGDRFKKEGGGMVTGPKGDPLIFMSGPIKYEIDRLVTGNYHSWNSPKPFSNWDKDPKKAKLQKEFVNKIEAKSKRGELLKYKTVRGSGLGVKDVEVADAIAEEIIASSGLSEAMGFQAVNRAGFTIATEEQRKKIQATGMAGDIANILNTLDTSEFTVDIADPNSGVFPLPDVTPPPDNPNQFPPRFPGNVADPPPSTGGAQSTATKIRERPGGPSGGPTRIIERAGDTRDVSEDKPPDETGKRPPPDVFKPEPIDKKKDEEDEDDKKKDKEKDDDKDRRRPPPEPEEDEPEDDETEDASTQTPPPAGEPKRSDFPELRPYFAVGGEDTLRATQAQKKQEMRDWNLFSYIPGHINQSADNPLTQLENKQYNFRMQHTKPDPVPVVPRGFDGYTPTPMMRNIYQRDQPMFNSHERSQYCGNYMQQHQNRKHVSDFLDMRDRQNIRPDMMSIRYPNGRNGRTESYLEMAALALASKSVM